MTRSLTLLGSLVLVLPLSCSSSDASPVPANVDEGGASQPDSGTPGAEAGADVVSTPIAVPCTDTADAVYGDPGVLTGDRGAILKCATDKAIDKDSLDALARDNLYVGRPLTSGLKAYRVSYRTERASPGSAAAAPAPLGFSSAIVLVPDTPRASQLPVVVASHGTVGQGGKCTPTRQVLEASHNHFALQILTLAGAGYLVIAPDYAGYANYGASGNPPGGYASSDDEGRSVLDAARAVRNLFPQTFTDKVVLVGHSQGGHAVLSALAQSGTYGAGGTVAGVVAYSPLWFNEAAWGAMLGLSVLFPVAQSHFTVSVGLWYHYSHAELLDGPGQGVNLFAMSARAGIKNFFDNVCGGDDMSSLDALGTNVADLYDPAFVQSVGFSSAQGSPCTSDAGDDATCEKWRERYAADRPHITGDAAHVPMLVLYGTADTTIPPERATCGFDRLKADGANAKFCVVPGADHGGIVAQRADYVADWIAAQTVGGDAPAPCDYDETSISTTCAMAPPND